MSESHPETPVLHLQQLSEQNRRIMTEILEIRRLLKQSDEVNDAIHRGYSQSLEDDPS